MILIIISLGLDEYFRLKNFKSSRVLIKIIHFVIEIKVRLVCGRLILIENQIIVDFRRFQSIVISILVLKNRIKICRNLI